MKRIVSLVLCMALAIGSVTYKSPQAKAIVLESTGAAALVGLFLVSMGLYWAYDNYQSAVAGAPVTKFGSNLAEELDEYIYEQTGEHRNVIEVMFHGDPDMGPNLHDDLETVVGTVVTVSAAAVASISAFGKWLYDKYTLAENDSVVVAGGDSYLFLEDGSYFYLSSWPSGNSPSTMGTKFYLNDIVTFSDGSYILTTDSKLTFYNAVTQSIDYTSNDCANAEYFFLIAPKYKNWISIGFYRDSSFWTLGATIANFDVGVSEKLSVSAPNGLNTPDTDELPEGQGYALEFPDIIADDFPGLLEQAVPQVLTNPEYVPTLNPTEIINPNPNPSPDSEEAPDPAPEGATIIDYLVDIWRKIKALPETIGNGIKKAFEPDPELVTEITTTFTDKFGWLETIHRFGQDLFGMTADTAPPVIYIHLEDAEGQYNYGGMEKALDMSWYQRYKADVDRILSGFMWIAFLWLVFKRASVIIQGGEMVTEYTNDLDQGHR